MELKESILHELAADLAGDGGTKVVEAVSGALLQQVTASKASVLRPALQMMQEQLQRRSWNLLQKWSDWGDDGPIMYPDNTRLYYKKGNSAVVFIEQKPSVRSVVFDHRMVDSRSAEMGRTFNFNLAFPYMIFMFSFRKGLRTAEQVFFLNEPFASMDQKPLAPILPNLNDNTLQICWGSGVGKPVVHEEDRGNIIKQVNDGMNYYWSSKFTGEWDSHYQAARKLDPRLATPRKWEEHSRQDPLFPLSVPWKATSYPTFRYIVSTAWDNDDVVQTMQKELFTAIVDESIGDLETAFLDIPLEIDMASAKKALHDAVIAKI